ncbi:MFS transporter [Pokkaliibacter plantistimulans]|uniref:MFS transporter n=1 Tax=Proteobacteria bacterium 228 TaxID=2083153 RepID=A0A2S5KXG4_9PROT|nr:MFS transporter [Pokkaliibacter plantistimulans]PPC78966.1 MFS transporter [Pokkaliibacter plantistimulans]
MSTSSSRLPWLVLAAGSLILALNLGIRQTMSLLIPDMLTMPTLSLSAMGLAFAIQNLIWGVASPLAGMLADRFGTARVLALGALIYAGGLVLTTYVTTAWQLNLNLGLILGLGVGATTFPLVLSAVGRAFPPEQRSRALGLASAGGSVGQFLMAPIMDSLNRHFGWQEALLLVALMALLILPCATQLKGRPAQPAAGMSLRQAVQQAGEHKGYWLLNLGFFVCGFHVAFIATHLPTYISLCGMSSQVSANGLAMIGLFNIFGSLTAGFLGARYRPKWLLSAIYGLRALVILLFWLAPKTPVVVLMFTAAIGFLWLSTVPLTTGTLAQIFGSTYMATLFGVVMLSHQIGAFFGAWLGGTLMDMTGSFDLMWGISIALGLMAMVIHLPVDDRPVSARTQPSAA